MERLQKYRLPGPSWSYIMEFSGDRHKKSVFLITSHTATMRLVITTADDHELSFQFKSLIFPLLISINRGCSLRYFQLSSPKCWPALEKDYIYLYTFCHQGGFGLNLRGVTVIRSSIEMIRFQLIPGLNLRLLLFQYFKLPS